MSGGSFNYISYNLDADKIFAHLSDLEDMYAYIKDDKELEAIAKELKRYVEFLYKLKLQIDGNGFRLFEVIHAIEWWASCDSGKDDVLKAWEETKAKSCHKYE